MKILIISDQEKIIEKIPLIKDQFFIGRSAICDVSLRKNNLKEIHFTVQKKIRDDSTEPEWIIFANSDDSGLSTEYRLDNEKKHIDSLFFSLSEDRRLISQSSERRSRVSNNDRRKSVPSKKGGLAKNLRQEEVIENENTKQNLVLEVIFIKISLNTVTNVIHLRGQNRKWHCFAAAPGLYLTINRFGQHILKGISKNTELRVFVAGLEVTQSIKEKTEHTFSILDQVNIHLGDMEYIIRFVPKQEYTIKKRSIFEDNLFLFSMTTVVVLLTFGILLRFIPLPVEKLENRPTRFIRLEKNPVPEVPKELPHLEKIVPIESLEKMADESLPAEPLLQKEPALPKASVKTPTEKKTVRAVEKKAAVPSILQFLKNKQSQSLNDTSKLESKVMQDSDSNNDTLEARFKGNSGESGLKVKREETEANLDSAKGTVKDLKLSQQGLGKIANSGDINQNALSEMGKAEKSGRIGTGGSSGGLSISGVLSGESVLQSIRANSAAFTGCHDSALLRNPNLQGTMVFSWVITGSGRVTSLKLVSSDINDTGFKVCIEDVLRSVQFESSGDGRSTKVSNPFHFRPKTE